MRAYAGSEPTEWPAVTYTPMPGLAAVTVPGCVAGCRHEWVDAPPKKQSTPTAMAGRFGDGNGIGRIEKPSEIITIDEGGSWCSLCGGWRGALGLEPDPQLYVAHLVLVFREVWRVLREDGCCWINLGDSFTSGGRTGHGTRVGYKQQTNRGMCGEDDPPRAPQAPGLKPKDLCGIPWRVAFALQGDGWWLRSDPPWIKGNPMPSSQQDRPTVAHEYWFLLTKSARYHYDAEAVREPAVEYNAFKRNSQKHQHDVGDPGSPRYRGGHSQHEMPQGLHPTGHNGRTRRTSDFFYESLDATIAHLRHIRDNGGMLMDADGLPLALCYNTKGYKGAHFATFNTDLITPMVRASVSERGCCPTCGKAWVRVVEKARRPEVHKSDADIAKDFRGAGIHRAVGQQYQNWLEAHPDQAIGHRPACDCYGTAPWPRLPRKDKDESDDAYQRRTEPIRRRRERLMRVYDTLATVPCRVLDPFVGSGTTLLVARQEGCDGVGLDLSGTYLRDQARKRLELDALDAWENGVKADGDCEPLDELPLFAGTIGADVAR